MLDKANLLDKVGVTDSFTVLLEQSREDSIDRRQAVLEVPLLQANFLPGEKEPNSSFVNLLHLSTDSGDTGSESDEIGDEAINIVYQAVEEEGNETAEGEEGSKRGSAVDAVSDVGSNAGSDDNRGFLLADSAYGCLNRPFNLRLTWLRLVVTAVTCVCTVLSLMEVQRQVTTVAPPTPTPTPSLIPIGEISLSRQNCAPDRKNNGKMRFCGVDVTWSVDSPSLQNITAADLTGANSENVIVCYRIKTQLIARTMAAGGNCTAYGPQRDHLFSFSKSHGHRSASWARPDGVFELWWEGLQSPLVSAAVSGAGVGGSVVDEQSAEGDAPSSELVTGR
jgi:hypothetical protein